MPGILLISQLLVLAIELASGFRLVKEFKHFQVGGRAARQFPVNRATGTQAKKGRTDGSHH